MAEHRNLGRSVDHSPEPQPTPSQTTQSHGQFTQESHLAYWALMEEAKLAYYKKMERRSRKL